METQIAHLHLNASILGSRDSASRLAERFERLDTQSLGPAFEEALAPSFAEDPRVYVLRDVTAKVMLGDSERTDRALAQELGRCVAATVVKKICRGDGGSVDLICFENETEYLCCFLQDLLAARAWSRWCYYPFEPVRRKDLSKTVVSALLEHRRHLPAVLVRLEREGALERLLCSVDEHDLRSLWAQGVAEHFGGPDPRSVGRVPPPDDGLPGREFAEETLRPLFAAALGIFDRLDRWRSRPDPDVLFRSYLGTEPLELDWRDREHLTDGVLDVMRFFHARGLIDSRPDEALPLDEQRLPHVFDWLDGPRLARGWGQIEKSAAGELPTRPPWPARWSPTQRRMLDLIEKTRKELEPIPELESRAALALRWYARILRYEPSWESDERIPALLQKVLDGWSQRPRRPLSAVPGSTECSPESSARLTTAGLLTPAAGLFLLLRTLDDLRFENLIEGSGFPAKASSQLDPMGVMLASLALRWMGSTAAGAVALDPGVACFAGLSNAITLEELNAAWKGDSRSSIGSHATFQHRLLERMVELRLVRDPSLRIYHLRPTVGREIVVAAAGEEGFWPLAVALPPDDESDAVLRSCQEVLQRWLAIWTAVFGEVKPTISCDAALAHRLDERQGPVRLEWIEAGESATVSPEAALHLRDRRQLEASFEALGAGRLGDPAVDLTLALTGILVLRAWSRWLGGFASSSVPFLLDNFIRRTGRVSETRETVTVHLPSQPLDLVLEMAGYTSDLERQPAARGTSRIELRLGGNG